MNFKPKKIGKLSKILESKVTVKVGNELLDQRRVTAHYDDIININKNNNKCVGSREKEHGGISLRAHKSPLV